MIKEAILALNERNESSPYTIAKYMEEKHKAVLRANFRKILGLQLKNSTAKGKLIKIKTSYKLSESGKKVKAALAKPAAKIYAPAAAKKARTAKPRAAAVGTKRKVEVTPKKKMATKKKATPMKPKQPKSIKLPAAKRAKKVVA